MIALLVCAQLEHVSNFWLDASFTSPLQLCRWQMQEINKLQ